MAIQMRCTRRLFLHSQDPTDVMIYRLDHHVQMRDIQMIHGGMGLITHLVLDLRPLTFLHKVEVVRLVAIVEHVRRPQVHVAVVASTDQVYAQLSSIPGMTTLRPVLARTMYRAIRRL